MRITSLGYNPVNQSTNNRNQMQNPAFNGRLEILAENLADVIGPKGLIDERGFDALVAHAKESLAALTARAVRPLVDTIGQGKKAVIVVEKAADEDAAKVCESYKAQCASGEFQGVAINFIKDAAN